MERKFKIATLLLIVAAGTVHPGLGAFVTVLACLCWYLYAKGCDILENRYEEFITKTIGREEEQMMREAYMLIDKLKEENKLLREKTGTLLKMNIELQPHTVMPVYRFKREGPPRFGIPQIIVVIAPTPTEAVNMITECYEGFVKEDYSYEVFGEEPMIVTEGGL